jgi:predicted enzyme related to lactoylglutathione lyase
MKFMKMGPSLSEMTMILETFARVFVDAGALDATCAFYSDLLGGEETMRFAYPEKGLELAAISSPKLSVLIIAGPPENRRPFEATRLTIKVDRLETVLAVLEKAGAEQLEPIQPTPVGRKTRFRHADGLIVEYVDHAQKH